jgi:ArsR family transcriptional regulator
MAGVIPSLRALSNPNRLRVYQCVCRAGRRRAKGITIERICGQLGMKQPAVSHHVARLAAAGLIVRTKSRWWVYCTAPREGLEALVRFVKNPEAPLDRSRK